MVDQFLNGLLFLLFCGVVVMVFSIASPMPVVPTPPIRSGVQPPSNWFAKSGRWECTEVTPDAVIEMLRALRLTSRVPRRIRIEPPYAEVVW
jgi:hypothetical protein